jgi:hypothetical protein
VPVIRRDVSLGVFTRSGIDVLEQPLQWSDKREADPLHDRGTQRNPDGCDPSDFRTPQ